MNHNRSLIVLCYLLVAFAAVVISIPLTLFFKTIILMAADNKDLYAAMSNSWDIFVTKSYPWKLMVFTTALCLAYQLDTKKIGKLDYTTMRWIEGALQASVALVTAYATYSWLTKVNPDLDQHLVLSKLLIRSSIIGFVIGYTIPYWYKVAPKQRAIEKEEDITLNNETVSVIQKA